MAFPNKFSASGLNTKSPFPNTNAATQKTKPRGGWDDDEDEAPQLRGGSGPYAGSQKIQQPANKIDLKSPVSSNSYKSDEIVTTSPNKKGNPAVDYEIVQCDENFVMSHEYENNMINDLIQPGGARLKQPESSINNFCRACESFQPPVVGSLLVSKLYEPIPYISKARLLFLIEAIVKKVKKYFEYFKHNMHVLRNADFSNEGPNATQLSKLVNDIIQYIEEPNKPKQTLAPARTTSNSSASNNSMSNNANLLDDNDLLGPSEPKAKQDPFAFVKKQASDKTPQSQTSGNQDFGLLDMHSDTQTQNQPLSKAQSQPQSQARKFNPFDIGGDSPNVTSNQNSTQPSSNVPLSFKKFQGGAPTTQANQTPPNNAQNQPAKPSASKFDHLDDLLENFTGLDFGGNKVDSQATPNQGNPPSQGHQNQPGPSSQGQGYPNPQAQGFGGPSQYNQGQFSPQHYPPYGGQSGPGASYPGGPGSAPTNQWGGHYPQGQHGYPYPSPNFGHGQPHYGHPQQFNGNAPHGQPGMYGGAPQQNQANMPNNSYTGQPGMYGQQYGQK